MMRERIWRGMAIFAFSVIAVVVVGPYYVASVGGSALSRSAAALENAQEQLMARAHGLPVPVYNFFSVDSRPTIQLGENCRGRLTLRTFSDSAPSLTYCQDVSASEEQIISVPFRANDLLVGFPGDSMVVHTKSRLVVAADDDSLLWLSAPGWLPMMVEMSVEGLPLSVIVWAPLWFLAIPFVMTLLVSAGSFLWDWLARKRFMEAIRVAIGLPHGEVAYAFVEELGEISRSTNEAVEEIDARSDERRESMTAMVNSLHGSHITPSERPPFDQN